MKQNKTIMENNNFDILNIVKGRSEVNNMLLNTITNIREKYMDKPSSDTTYNIIQDLLILANNIIDMNNADLQKI